MKNDNSDLVALLVGIGVLIILSLTLSVTIDRIKEEHRKDMRRVKRHLAAREVSYKDEYKKLQDEVIERGYATLTIDAVTRKTQFEWISKNNESETE
jgi:hypothetical protein